MFWFVLFGWLSDKIGRKPPIVVGYALTLILLFPLFHWMASAANPELAVAMDRNPVTVQGTNCAYNPFLTRQPTPCGRALDILTRRGIAYTFLPAPGWRGTIIRSASAPMWSMPRIRPRSSRRWSRRAIGWKRPRRRSAARSGW